MTCPENCKYTKDHEWAEQQSGNTVRIGITEYAQKELGDVVFVELPEVGDTFKQGQSFATVESVKAVSDVYAPIAGKVVEVNKKLIDAPETINNSPHENGWMIKLEVSDMGQLSGLMDAKDYSGLLAEISK